jgi:hypothetical protein
MNYFYGNEEDWVSNVRCFEEIIYSEIYKKIDLRFYFNEDGLKYDFILNPGSNPDNIKIEIEGINSLQINDNSCRMNINERLSINDGNLLIFDDDQNEIDGSFKKISENLIQFRISNYNKNSIVTIDPLIYSTYLGGTGDDRGIDIEIDDDGFKYILGRTTSNNFPTSVGSYDQTTNGYTDVVITKFNKDCTSIVYSTYFGGSNEDIGYGLEVDSNGNTVITGVTYSSDLPTKNALDSSLGGQSDVFITKLNSTGTGLVFSTYMGGAGEDILAVHFDQGADVAIDQNNSIYVSGRTTSNDLPTTSGAFDTTYNGGWDVFLLKMNPTGSILNFLTYIGGTDNEEIYSLDIDKHGYLYVLGVTASSESEGFPVTTGSFDSSYNGGTCDSYIVKVKPDGSDVEYGGYIGGSSQDYALEMVVDDESSAYITGMIMSSDLPTTLYAYDRTYNGGSNDMFIAKINSGGDEFGYLSYIGGSSGYEYAYGITINPSGHIYVTGETQSSNFPMVPESYDNTFNGGVKDQVIFVIDENGTNLINSTFIGGSGGERPLNIEYENGKIIYVGVTDANNYPTTPNAFDSTHNGGNDIFLGIMTLGMMVEFQTVSLDPYTPKSGNQCKVETTITNNLQEEFEWIKMHFGDEELLNSINLTRLSWSDYEGEITIDENWEQLYFKFETSIGSQIDYSDTYYSIVEDVINPIMIDDETDSAAMISNPFHFKIDITDNHEVVRTHVVYHNWIDDILHN